MNLILGDSLDELIFFKENSIDAVVTDPPYGLSFMGKKWDYNVPTSDFWYGVFLAMKPGAHLLSFGGTRTYHRMVCAIEDAGFEIRDQVQWIYGSGFPKSLDVSKAIDKAAGAEREVVGKAWAGRGAGGNQSGTFDNRGPGLSGEQVITAPTTPDARTWSGWGTALKPANEPIVLARKPLEKGLTVAKNVLKWGTGAINVDASRIATDDTLKEQSNPNIRKGKYNAGYDGRDHANYIPSIQGRWPANVLLDEDAAEGLDAANLRELPARFFYVAKASKRERNAGLEGMPERKSGVTDGNSGRSGKRTAGDGVTPIETPRAQNHHPTVKPVRLMEYLVRMICPPGGVVLDPFMGSGTTGIAVKNLKRKFIGIEREQEYFNIAKRRIENA